MEQASDSNRKDLGEIDLFIVSDTPVRHDTLYEAQPVAGAGGKGLGGWLRRQRLGTIHMWGWIMTIVLGLGVVESIRHFSVEFNETHQAHSMFDLQSVLFWLHMGASLLAPAVIVGLAVYALIAIWIAGHRMAESLVETMPPMRRSLWYYAKNIRFGQLLDMAILRATSMSALTARIFMNRIRQLGYAMLYSHEEFGKRMMINNINDIRSLSEGRGGDLPDFVRSPSEQMVFVVERAAKMKTKLWIDKPDHDRHDLEILIAAGHISTCFNVIEYLWTSHRDDDGRLEEPVRELFEFARADWVRLNEDPYWMVDRRKASGRKPGVLFWTSRATRRRGLLSGVR